MKRSEKGFAVQVLITLIAVFVSSGVFLFIYSQNREARVQAKLEAAREKVAVETQKLDELKKEFRDAYPFHAVIQDECARMIGIVQNTNVFFDTSDPANPKIKVRTKTSAIEAKINSRRAQVESILRDCKTNTATINSVWESASIIQSFINELVAIIDSLTSSNSGLTQSQIGAYAEILSEAFGEITDVISSLEAARSTVAGSSSTETGISQTTSITLEQIQTQEEVVTQAQTQVTILEEELQSIQSQNQNPTQQLPIGQQPNNTSSQDNSSQAGSVDYTSGNSSSDPLIVVPGLPKLIQGANKN